jgi:hypothetical protein
MWRAMVGVSLKDLGFLRRCSWRASWSCLGGEGHNDLLGVKPEVADVTPLPLPPELLAGAAGVHLFDERGEAQDRRVGQLIDLRLGCSTGGRIPHCLVEQVADWRGEPLVAAGGLIEIPHTGLTP